MRSNLFREWQGGRVLSRHCLCIPVGGARVGKSVLAQKIKYNVQASIKKTHGRSQSKGIHGRRSQKASSRRDIWLHTEDRP